MPHITTGGTMAPCVIIGERAAELLRNQHKMWDLLELQGSCIWHQTVVFVVFVILFI